MNDKYSMNNIGGFFGLTNGNVNTFFLNKIP